MSRSICSGAPFDGCGRVFSSVSSFDKHRRGVFGADRHCMTDEEMETAGFVVHPTKSHRGAPIWVEQVALERWDANKGILARTSFAIDTPWG